MTAPTSPNGAADWLAAVGAAAANFIGFGVLFGFGLFLTPLADEFETTTGPVAPLFAGSVLCYYFASMLGGLLADRHGPVPVVAFGAVAFPVGLFGSSMAGELWQVYLVYVPLVGLAVGSCYASLIGVIGRRFTERRALAIAVVLTGVGAGTLVMPVVIRLLLDQGGWRFAFRVLAAASAVIFLLTAVATRERAGTHRQPASLGLVAGIRLLAASPRFRRLYLSVVLIAPGFYAPLAFLNDHAVSEGIGTGTAALLVSSIGLSSAASRIGFGQTAARLGPLRQYRLSHIVFLVSLVIWFGSGGSPWAMAAAAVLHGLGWAAWVTAAPLVLTEWFGVEDLGFLVGGFYTGLGVGALIGPVVSGFVIDRAGYEPAIAVVVAASVLSLLTLAGGFEPETRNGPAAQGPPVRSGLNP